MTEVAEFIKKVVVDSKEVKSEVVDFISPYNTVHYAFRRDGAYDYVEF
jgi:glycine hydroxymethyltransferase